jgi:hypothetical protein
MESIINPTTNHVISFTEWQNNPDYNSLYVWYHITADSKPFYIGRGRASYAWDKTFGLIWEKYVADFLGGEYYIFIQKYNLDNEESEHLIDSGLQKYHSTLLNTGNFYRPINMIALERRNSVAQELKPLYNKYDDIKKFSSDEELISLCKTALYLQYELSNTQIETGLYGEMLNCFPSSGINMFFITPLLKSLIKLNKIDEANKELNLFLETKNAVNYLSSPSILGLQKRINAKLAKPV